jgi:hypothetical protein
MSGAALLREWSRRQAEAARTKSMANTDEFEQALRALAELGCRLDRKEHGVFVSRDGNKLMIRLRQRGRSVELLEPGEAPALVDPADVVLVVVQRLGLPPQPGEPTAA